MTGGSEGLSENRSAADSLSGSFRLTEVTSKAGLGDFVHQTGAFGQKWFPETVGAGGGFIDYNGDGWQDILLVGGGAWEKSPRQEVQALWLYENNGDGTFSPATKKAGLADVKAYGFGFSAADYDNDNDQDFFLTTLHENMLFRNNEGVFSEVGKKSGLADRATWSTSAIFFDADKDGWLDLYVGNYVDWSPTKDIWCTLDGETKEYCTPDLYKGVPGRFYQNNGDGTFTDRTKAAGFLPSPGNSFGIAALDYNDDGWTDLAVANDMQRNLLYKNNGDGTFDETGMMSGIAFGEDGKARAGMGIDAARMGPEGRSSIVVGNFAGEMVGFFQHTGNNLFMDRAAIARLGKPTLRTLTFGLFLFDVDLDGDHDLLAANGHIKPGLDNIQNEISYRQPAQLFLNKGKDVFKSFRPNKSALNQPMVARGAAYGDIDRDGDWDVLITENGGPAHLWRNDLEEGHFLRIRLHGRVSNRDGIGARIVATTGDQRIERFLRTGSSFLSQSDKTVILGLGNQTKVDSLVIHWPSGQTNRFANLAADREIDVIEGQKRLSASTTAP